MHTCWDKEFQCLGVDSEKAEYQELFKFILGSSQVAAQRVLKEVIVIKDQLCQEADFEVFPF